MKILKFNSYCESISGTEMIGSMGPNYGEQILPNTLSSSDTEVAFSTLNNQFYTKDEYDEIYGNYLKKGGKALNGFNKRNLDEVILFLSENE